MTGYRCGPNPALSAEQANHGGLIVYTGYWFRWIPVTRYGVIQGADEGVNFQVSLGKVVLGTLPHGTQRYGLVLKAGAAFDTPAWPTSIL